MEKILIVEDDELIAELERISWRPTDLRQSWLWMVWKEKEKQRQKSSTQSCWM